MRNSMICSSALRRCRMNYTDRIHLKKMVKAALNEDVGAGDITTSAVVPKQSHITAILQAKEDCVVCGVGLAGLVFKELDRRISFKPRVRDGLRVKRGGVIALVSGPAASILTAERAALNFLSLLSGTATMTRAYVDRARPYRVKIMDTRKTIPGLRGLQKFAVRAGGGFNHRFGLDEMALIKDNHIAVRCAGEGRPCMDELIRDARRRMPKGMRVEIEVKDMREFKQALLNSPDVIMLDNMSTAQIRAAVRLRDKARKQGKASVLLEASGGVTLKTVRGIASCGVDIISSGELTHSARSIDISLEVERIIRR